MGLVGSIIISKNIEKNRKKQEKIEKKQKKQKKIGKNRKKIIGKKQKKITFECDGFGRIDNNQ